MKTKFISEKVEKLVNSITDDAQYLKFMKLKSTVENGDIVLCEVETDGGVKYDLILKGDVLCTNYKGETINTILKFQEYLKKGKEEVLRQLNFDSMAYIEIIEKNNIENFIEIFTSIGECLFFIEKIEKGEINIESYIEEVL